MSHELAFLTAGAASIGLIHTVLGPDHYLPFIVMSRAGKWSRAKTVWVTVLCGLGHVLSSVVLGTVGIGLGLALMRLTDVESFRGSLAAWGLIAFGLVYFVWGLRRAWRNRPHRHLHVHGGEDIGQHSHDHVHEEDHVHVHKRETGANLTPWILFTVFVFGPCEPLIPFLMYPAARASSFGLVLVTTVFAATTILTMLTIVVLVSSGVRLIGDWGRFERYSHALAGATICLCGVAIEFLGL